MSTTPTPELLAMARQLAPEAARAQALERKLAQVRLSHVYAATGWEVPELARAEGVLEVASADALEAQLHDGAGTALLVRKSACASLAALKSLLESATAPCTVFYEYTDE